VHLHTLHIPKATTEYIASQCILHSTGDCNRGFQEVQIKKLSRIIPKLDSDLKDYFTIAEEGTKVKIKNTVFSYRYCTHFFRLKR